MENLGFIKSTDARQINLEEAIRFEELHLEAYDKFGYECLKVPSKPVADRVNEIVKFIG